MLSVDPPWFLKGFFLTWQPSLDWEKWLLVTIMSSSPFAVFDINFIFCLFSQHLAEIWLGIVYVFETDIHRSSAVFFSPLLLCLLKRGGYWMHYSIKLYFETVLASDEKNQKLKLKIYGVFRPFFHSRF